MSDPKSPWSTGGPVQGSFAPVSGSWSVSGGQGPRGMPPVPPTAWLPDPDSELGLVAERQAIFASQTMRFDFRGVVATSVCRSLLRILSLTTAAVLVGTLLSDGVLFGLLDRTRNVVSGEEASWPIIGALGFGALSLVAAVVMPTLKVALSRLREYRADALATRLRRDSSGLALALQRTLQRISENPKVTRADHAVAEVYILSPFGSSLVDRLLSTYPPRRSRSPTSSICAQTETCAQHARWLLPASGRPPPRTDADFFSFSWPWAPRSSPPAPWPTPHLPS